MILFKSVVRIIGYCSEPFSIVHSDRKRCHLSFILYALALETLLQKLKVLSVVPRDLGSRRRVTTYAGDTTIIVPCDRHLYLVGDDIKEYE